MSQQRDDVFSLYPETLVIGASLTALISPLPGQNFTTIKYGGGGTLCFSAGATNSYGCSFAINQYYPIGTTEAFHFNGAGYFKLTTFGATTTVYINRGISAGFSQL